MRTRKLPEGKGLPVLKADDLIAITKATIICILKMTMHISYQLTATLR
jgi:hypothetical protein